MLTYYEVLSVEPTADRDVIRRAWRLKVRLLHPDRHHDSPDDVQAEAAKETLRANLAWDTLQDPDKRREYDARVRRMHDGDLESQRPQPASEARSDMADPQERLEWLEPFTYLDLVSFLIVVVAMGFVVAGAVLLARLTQ